MHAKYLCSLFIFLFLTSPVNSAGFDPFGRLAETERWKAEQEYRNKQLQIQQQSQLQYNNQYAIEHKIDELNQQIGALNQQIGALNQQIATHENALLFLISELEKKNIIAPPQNNK